MRIVSFLPSATELVFELGAGNDLVGVTHECTYPEQAKTKPRVISSVFDPEQMTSLQIDEKISDLAKNCQPIFSVHEENIRNAKPDLIIAQGTCAVCSAYTNEVNSALQILERKPHVETLDPHTVEDVLASVTTIARLIGKNQEGQDLVKSLQTRINLVKNKTHINRPKTLCIEWIEPFFTSGHWIPQMIEIAGGTNLISTTGEHSRKMTLDEVVKADPDIIIMMPCGFDTKRTIQECSVSLQSKPKWQNLRAVRNKNCYAVDANSYFSKPSIRIVTGIEILAKIMHPDEFASISVPDGAFAKI